MVKDEDIINFEYGGWPIYKMTFRDVLVALGAEIVTVETGPKSTDSFIGFNASNDVLDKYAITLEDDGMGYGVNEKYIVEASTSKGYDKINFFREKALTKEEIDKEIERQKSLIE